MNLDAAAPVCVVEELQARIGGRRWAIRKPDSRREPARNRIRQLALQPQLGGVTFQF
jgi:hypothetical protein